MSDYINREAVIKMLWDLVELDNAYDMKKQAVEIVQNWESSDVVEVVRCKDCKHYKRNIPCVGGHYNGCDEWIDEGNAITVYDNDFCSFGERADK